MGAWDIDMSMADTISKVDCISVCYADNTFALTTPSQVDSRQGSSVPFIHFGLIELSKDMGFVAGGFSRVYFGQYKNQPIALKMLFVVDLTPQSVKEFCKEANLLIKLKNENVIVCKGVSVMPPAISIVLEFCKYGSLFDLLYKERHTRKHFYQNSLNVLLGPDTIPQHSTRVFSVASASDNLNPLNRRSFMSDGRGSDGIAPAELSSRSCTVSNESSGISETLIRSSQTRSRKSFFGRESLFGGKAVREESKNLLFTHSQSKLSSEWDKLRRWFTDNPGYSASPIIEDEFSMQSEASLFRWSSSQVSMSSDSSN